MCLFKCNWFYCFYNLYLVWLDFCIVFLEFTCKLLLLFILLNYTLRLRMLLIYFVCVRLCELSEMTKGKGGQTDKVTDRTDARKKKRKRVKECKRETISKII